MPYLVEKFGGGFVKKTREKNQTNDNDRRGSDSFGIAKVSETSRDDIYARPCRIRIIIVAILSDGYYILFVELRL